MLNFAEWLDNPQLIIAETLLHLFGIREANQIWEPGWTTNLFTPPRQFDSRKKARKFLNWLASYGVPVQSWLDQMDAPVGNPLSHPAPEAFAGGQVGKAYPVGNYIVKFTGDPREAQYATKIIGQDMPWAAKVYDVVEIPGDFKGRKIFAIILEKLNTGMSKKYRVAGEAVYKYLDFNPQILDDVEAATKITAQKYIPPKWKDDPDVLRAIHQLFQSVKGLYSQSGIHYRDAHGGNLAFKGRTPAFFDLGQSTPHGSQFPTPRGL